MERLSGLDAMFLYLETPTHHMHVAMTMVLDPATMADGYQFETLKEQVRNRLPLVPPFTRRPAAGAVPARPPGVDRGSRLRPGQPRLPGRRAGAGRPATSWRTSPARSPAHRSPRTVRCGRSG